MLISVIIPVYNTERYIRECLESVLNQTYKNLEIIVVDDGSTDRTATIVAEYPQIKYLYQTNSGPSAALNKGIDASNGEFVSFIDADDYWTKDKLELQMAEFLQAGKHQMIFGYVEQFISPELPPDVKKKLYCPADRQPGLYRATLLMKKVDLLRVGYFITGYTLGEFIEWFARANSIGFSYLLVNRTVTFRRLHETNLSRKALNSRADFARILKVSLDRQRGATDGNL